MTRSSKLLYLAQVLCGTSIITVFNPINARWMYAALAIPAGVFLIVTAGYGFAKHLPYKKLPLWVRILGILGIIGWVLTLLSVVVLRIWEIRGL